MNIPENNNYYKQSEIIKDTIRTKVTGYISSIFITRMISKRSIQRFLSLMILYFLLYC